MQAEVVSLSGNVHLLVVLVGLVVDNVEEAELVDTLGGGNNTEPVTELLLLEELLGKVLEVTTRKLLVGNDLDLYLALLADLDVITEVTGAALDLDAVVEELLESLDVEDLVVDGLRAVDDELLRHLLVLLGGGAALGGRHLDEIWGVSAKRWISCVFFEVFGGVEEGSCREARRSLFAVGLQNAIVGY